MSLILVTATTVVEVGAADTVALTKATPDFDRVVKSMRVKCVTAGSGGNFSLAIYTLNPTTGFYEKLAQTVEGVWAAGFVELALEEGVQLLAGVDYFFAINTTTAGASCLGTASAFCNNGGTDYSIRSFPTTVDHPAPDSIDPGTALGNGLPFFVEAL